MIVDVDFFIIKIYIFVVINIQRFERMFKYSHEKYI